MGVEDWGPWDSSQPRDVLPGGLDEMAPGPELAQVLAGIDREGLNGHELAVVVAARHRLVSWLQAEELADIATLAHCPPGDASSAPERGPVDEYASDELRITLTWTRRAADCHLGLALDLYERLPQVWETLRGGVIDLPKARVISDGTGHLDDDKAARVADEILADAEHLTTGQLAARLRSLCFSADPDDAKRRYEDAVDERRVTATPNPDGTGTLYGFNLPSDRLNSIMGRINQLAKTQPVDGRSIDQRRADVLMDLLEGIHHGAPSPSRPGTVDIRVGLPTLMGLDDNPADIPGWGPVIADIARRVADQASRWQVTVTDSDSGDTVWTGITRRRPSAAQRRHSQARTPTCVFPGCRMPATASDLDHTIAYADGGDTTSSNLAPLCRHDHMLKHHGTWTLAQPTAGIHQWTTPHGHTHTTSSQPP